MALEAIKELETHNDEKYLLQIINAAIIKNCKETNVSEDIIRNYVIGVINKQNCKDVVEQIVDRAIIDALNHK
jgi:hypothetical protein